MGFDFDLKEIEEKLLLKLREDILKNPDQPNQEVAHMLESTNKLILMMCRKFTEENNKLLWEELKSRGLV